MVEQLLDFDDQQTNLPSYENRVDLCEMLHDRVVNILTDGSVPIIESSFRAKTDESIRLKILRRPLIYRWRPMADIYGVRFILAENDIDKATESVVASFPEEYRFPYPFPYIRDLRDGNTPRTVFSDSRYQAVHVYVTFGSDTVPYIGEIKLMTPEQLLVDINTRKQYEERQGRYS